MKRQRGSRENTVIKALSNYHDVGWPYWDGKPKGLAKGRLFESTPS